MLNIIKCISSAHPDDIELGCDALLHHIVKQADVLCVTRSLRWKLTFLYLVIAIGLVGAGTYLQIDRYFQQTTYLAVQYKTASQFRALCLEVPNDLKSA